MNETNRGLGTSRAGSAVDRRALFAGSFLTAEHQLDFATSFLDRAAHAAQFFESQLVAGAREVAFGESFLDRSR